VCGLHVVAGAREPPVGTGPGDCRFIDFF